MAGGVSQKDWPNVRLKPNVNDGVVELSKNTGESRIDIVSRAVERELRRQTLGAEWENKDPEISPLTSEETELVRMVLAIFRNPYDRAESSTLKLLCDLYAQRLNKKP